MFHTDKVGHGYLPTYLDLAARIGTGGKVCEVGVAGGDSLDMWLALFPHGLVVGVDNNPAARWPDGSVRILHDQAAADLGARVLDTLIGGERFDLVVDDASHDSGRTRATFGQLWPLVRTGGWYVIEDWSHCDLMMGDLAAELPSRFFDERQPCDIESVLYRRGLIVIRKVG